MTLTSLTALIVVGLSGIEVSSAATVRSAFEAGEEVRASAVPVQDSLPSLSGTVRSELHGDLGVLRTAVVQLDQGGELRSFRVGADGVYRFDGLRPGAADLEVFHVGTHPFAISVQLPRRGPVELDLVLRTRVIPLAAVHIRAVPEPAGQLEPPYVNERSRAAVGLTSLDASSGFDASGLVSALAADEPGEPRGFLFTRGSNVDARLVLLDGAPILTPFHVAGLVEPFDARLLGTTELYLGGAPAPYTEGVSYLLDIETRPARRDRPRLELGMDGLTLDGMMELPLPANGSLLVGGRFLHGMQESLGDVDRFPYRYEDLLVRAGFTPSPSQDLRITGFRNREGVRLDLGGAGERNGRDAEWGNQAVSLRYAGRIGGIEVETTAAASRYDSRLPVSSQEPVLASGVGDRLRIASAVSVRTRRGSFRVGGSMERLAFGYALSQLGEETDGSLWDDPLDLDTSMAGAFAEWDGRVGDQVAIRAGIRGDRYEHEEKLRVAPRLSVTVPLGERVRLFSAAGMYHQVLPAPGLRSESQGDAAPAVLGWNPLLPVASATHLVIGIEQALDPNTDLSLSAFAKRFEGLGQQGEDRSRSSGLELRVQRSGSHLRGWFGYALSWFWVNEGIGGSTRFDGRHLLSIGVKGDVPGGVELRGTIGYGAGLPMTAIGLPSQAAADPDGGAGEDFQAPSTERVMNTGGGGAPLELAPEGDFLRLDFEVAWPINTTIAGRSTQIRPYLKVLNALNRRDALFYYFDRWHEEDTRPLAERALLPLVGLRWQF